ncbi:patched domain-containing protein 3-like [Centruroides vittatus]|uniref:patched domain-containing protein 3-like n=1 Tax=Centruroides vittatus TaxID=120091 RepID=UPI0035103A93
MDVATKTKCQLPHHIFVRNFYTLGGHITRNPYWFVALPFFITLVLSTGLQKIKEIVDMEYFVTMDDSDTFRYRKVLDTLFPMNLSSEFELGRYTRLGRFGAVLLVSKDDSVLKKSTFHEILLLDETVKNITIVSEFGEMRYKDLCVKHGDSCYMHDFFTFADRDNNTDNINIPYPIDFNSKYTFKFYGASFGGVEIDNRGLIKTAKALRLFYYLDDSRHKNDITLWENEFLRTMKSLRLPHFDVYYIVSTSVAYEMHLIPLTAIPYFVVAAHFVVLFTTVTCMVPNSVQGKPWVGIMTSISSLLSSLSGFGLAFYLGIPYIFYNAIIPFLILGVSMDDTFVLLSAWRHTEKKNSIEQRMSEAYSTASLAISITSLTNVITFTIGYLMSPYDSVRVFCIVTTFCLVFDYVYQITFVGGCMVLCGIAEEKDRHCFTFMPVKYVENTEIRGIFQKLLYYTGHIQLTTTSKTSFLLEIWKKLGELLTKKVSKLVVLVLFIVYFVFGLQNATQITNELEMGNMALYNTHTDKYFTQYHKYFVQYLVRVQVFIDRPINYADPYINRTLHDMFQKFESSALFSNSSLTESWLRSFHEFVNSEKYRGLLPDYNITDKKDFIRVLRLFLHHPHARRFQKDIVFNENRTEIVASRFLFHTNYTKSDSVFNNMWWDFLNDVKNESIPVKVFHRFGYFSDGFRKVIPATLQTIGISAGIVAFVCFFFFFSFSCTLCVAICIVSVAIGVLGYMRLWGVSLNIVSMTVIITISGFSVDYASHVSCAYLFASKSSKQRLVSAITDVGLPIFQAGSTTILCVIPFIIPPCYTYNVIMKVVILVSIFAMTHAVIFLPVFLSLLDDACTHFKNIFKRKQKVNISNKSDNGHLNCAFDAKDVNIFSYKNDTMKL